MSPAFKSTGVGCIGAKFGEEGVDRLTDVSQILTRSGRDTGFLMQKKS